MRWRTAGPSVIDGMSAADQRALALVEYRYLSAGRVQQALASWRHIVRHRDPDELLDPNGWLVSGPDPRETLAVEPRCTRTVSTHARVDSSTGVLTDSLPP